MDFKDKKNEHGWRSNPDGFSDEMFSKIWQASGSYKERFQPDMEAGLASFQQRMAAEKSHALIVPIQRQRKIWLRVAAGLAVLAIGILVFKGQIGTKDDLYTLASTPDGTLEHSLPDGTQIELNHSSELSFIAGFDAKERNVKLNGEAFFDVKRDETRPFIIEAGEAKVTVLGTSFNVRAYPNEEIIEVFVVSGKVQVEIQGAKQPKILNKGDLLRFNKKALKIELATDQVGAPVAWHTGILSFKGQPIPTILDGMERLYGVKFDLKTSQATNCLQTLTVQEGELQEAIQALKLSCPKMKFEEAGNGNYTVEGACCE
ncbi:MAG: FecR domain-containing protein [Saprospiraceae bacterium]|nr:FecR domain-containing protein [Saprospiraceae bacterium]